MKRFLLVPIVALSLALSGCALTGGGGTGGASSPTLSRILQRNELVVGMTGSQPPLSMRTASGRIIGLDADLARLMASGMGVELKIKTMAFADLLPSLRNGTVDMVISGLTITPERNTRVAFVGPYFISGKSILTKSKTLAELDSTDEINASRFTLTALKGSTSQTFVEELMPNVKLVTTEGYDEAVRLVSEDKADALVADFPFCVVAALRDPSGELDSLAEPLTYEPLGIALPGNDPLLVNLADNVITVLEGTGALLKLKARWFATDDWLAELPAR